MKTIQMVIGKRSDELKYAIAKTEPLSSHLAFNISDSQLSVLITEIKDNQHLHHFQFELQDQETSDILKICSDSETPFRSVSLSSHAFARTLVPLGMFDKHIVPSYLDFVFGKSQQRQADFQLMDSIESALVFERPALAKQILDFFPMMKSVHASGILLESMIRESRFEDAPQVLLHREDTFIDIMIVNSRAPLFFNVFEVKSETDVVYHLLNVLEGCSIDHRKVTVTLSGRFKNRAEEIALLKTYCPAAASKGQAHKKVGSAMLDEYQLTLFNQHQCA